MENLLKHKVTLYVGEDENSFALSFLIFFTTAGTEQQQN